MKSLIFLIGLLLLSSCTNKSISIKAPSQDPQPTQATQSIHHPFLRGAKLCKIAYADKPNDAIKEFNAIGFDATYFSPKRGFLIGYPELFIISKPSSNEVSIIFVGTDSVSDWYQNIKVSNLVDKPKAGTFYLFPGHAGFRRGIFNLIHHKFFKTILPNHIDQYEVLKSENQSVDVTLIGHSQGAGLVQIALPVFDGYQYNEDQSISIPSNWPYRVKKALTYAVPYAVSKKPGKLINQWELIQNKYQNLVIVVLRDGDFVGSAYNVAKGHDIPVRHFGQYVRITRDHQVILEPTSWNNDQPHHIDTYIKALKDFTPNQE